MPGFGRDSSGRKGRFPGGQSPRFPACIRNRLSITRSHVIDTKGIVTNLIAAGIWLVLILLSRYAWRFVVEDHKLINHRDLTITRTLNSASPITFETFQMLKMLLDSIRTVFATDLVILIMSIIVTIPGIAVLVIEPSWFTGIGVGLIFLVQTYVTVSIVVVGLKLNRLQNRVDDEATKFITRAVSTARGDQP